MLFTLTDSWNLFEPDLGDFEKKINCEYNKKATAGPGKRGKTGITYRHTQNRPSSTGKTGRVKKEMT